MNPCSVPPNQSSAGGGVAVAADGNGLTQKSGKRLENTVEKVLVPRQNLPGFPEELAGVGDVLGGDAVGVQAQRAGIVDGAVEVVPLGDDEDLLGLEHVPGAVHALIGGEARVIEEHVL